MTTAPYSKRVAVLPEWAWHIVTALIGGLITLGGSVLAYLGIVRKSSVEDAKNYWEQATEAHKIAQEAAKQIRDELRVELDELREDLAHAENARREAEQALNSVKEQLDQSERIQSKLIRALKRYAPDIETLEEDSDVPNYVL